MLVCILVWVLYFALLGQFLFQNTSTGITEFGTFRQSYWNMFVCLTFENFPDVMLEATETNLAYALFFIIFVLVGSFFLTSVLLAVIFDNYKNRL